MTRDERLAELLTAWEDTTPGDGITAEDVCRSCPELLPDFRRLLGRLAKLNGLIDPIGGTVAAELIAGIDAGRYRPRSVHAQGGLGIILVAEDLELGRNVALKFMQPLASLDPGARDRFENEAFITARLEHPGVVPVHGMGRDRSGRPYYAMRFVGGRTLGEAIEAFHRDSKAESTGSAFQRLLRHFIEVCETVAFANSRGVIHRDLKPANIMIGDFGETLIVDWGLAKFANTEEEGRPDSLPPINSDSTVEGQVRGSPAYMSPEQARGEVGHVGPHGDVYSLGSILYFLLAGRKAYDGADAEKTVALVAAGRFPPPRRIRTSVPRSLEAVCLRAMAFRREDRYPDALSLASDLERWLADEPVTAWREPAGVRMRRWLKRHRTLSAAAAAVVLVSSGILAVMGYRLEQRNIALIDSNSRESAARQSAERNLTRNLNTLEGLLRTGFLAKKRDPASVPMLDEMCRRFDDFADEVPDSKAGRRIAALAHYLRVTGDPGKGLTAPLKSHLEKAERLFGRDGNYGLWGLAAVRNESARRRIEDGNFDDALGDVRSSLETLGVVELPGEAHALARAVATLLLCRIRHKAAIPPGEMSREIDSSLAMLRSASKSIASETMARIIGEEGLSDAPSPAGPLGWAYSEAALLLSRGELRIESGEIAYADRDFRAALSIIADGPVRESRDPILIELGARIRYDIAGLRKAENKITESWVEIAAARSMLRSFEAESLDEPELQKLVLRRMVEIGLARMGSGPTADVALAVGSAIVELRKSAIPHADAAQLLELLRWQTTLEERCREAGIILSPQN